MHLDKIRMFFLCISWFSGTIHVIFGQTASSFANVGALSLLIFAGFTLSRLKKESFSIIIILLFVAFFFLDQLPTFENLLSGGRFVLIFSALLPTMILVRSVSNKIKRVMNKQYV